MMRLMGFFLIFLMVPVSSGAQIHESKHLMGRAMSESGIQHNIALISIISREMYQMMSDFGEMHRAGPRAKEMLEMIN
jgi:hypothetical protein